MLRIKLAPTGKRNEQHFRIVVAEDRSKITGNPSATLGHYHPKTGQLTVDKPGVALWIQKGAQPTTRIRKLLKL